ncbi:MAG TPA: hypothetical protein VFY10_04170, partial [Dehalococcoidia bacterium]|nr:hypothetical protein [Dehalococcoidia bacterium]
PMWKQYERWHDIYYEGSTETYRSLEAMAKELNTIVRPDQTLATHDIGAVGYFADYKVLDLVGLENADVIKYDDNRTLAAYIEQQKPDYLLIFPDWDVYFLHLDTANQPDRYELIKQYPGGAVRPQTYLLFKVHYN